MPEEPQVKPQKKQDDFVPEHGSLESRAYKIHEEKGGSESDNWREAERILKEEHNKSSKPLSAQDGKTIYTCPMHPEIKQDHPGDCPKCGMHLEPLNPTGEGNEDQKEIHSLSQKFWIGLALTVPLVLLVLGDMIPVVNIQAFIPQGLLPFIQLALATPVVLWVGGIFFVALPVFKWVKISGYPTL